VIVELRATWPIKRGGPRANLCRHTHTHMQSTCVHTNAYICTCVHTQVRLAGEREASLRLKGENGIMRKKFNALQKDIEAQKEEIKNLFEQVTREEGVVTGETAPAVGQVDVDCT